MTNPVVGATKSSHVDGAVKEELYVMPSRVSWRRMANKKQEMLYKWRIRK